MFLFYPPPLALSTQFCPFVNISCKFSLVPENAGEIYAKQKKRAVTLQRRQSETIFAPPLHFPPHCAILYPVKTEYDSRCLFARRFAAQKRVKGKRVQIPHDLVTVIREPAAKVRLHRSLGISPGRRRWVLIFQPGNLPAAGYGGAQLQITRNWLYRKEPAESTGSFCVAILHAKRPRFLIGVFCCAFPCHATF